MTVEHHLPREDVLEIRALDAEIRFLKLEVRTELGRRALRRNHIISTWMENLEISDPENYELDIENSVLRLKAEAKKVEPEPQAPQAEPALPGDKK